MSFDGSDDLYLTAIDIFVREQSVSISLLQRRMKIGYSLALSLIVRLENSGVVTKPNTNGLRVLTYGYLNPGIGRRFLNFLKINLRR